MKALTSISFVLGALILGSASGLRLPKLTVVNVPNGGTLGDWGPIEVCPGNSTAIGFSLKVEADQDGGDDTGLNAIALDCYDFSTHTLTEIKSTEGKWGNWGGRIACLEGGILTAFSLKVELHQRFDNTAANDIRFRCNSGEILEGHGAEWGAWGEWSAECPTGICGIQTRIHGDQGGDDDTALNDVQFLCC